MVMRDQSKVAGDMSITDSVFEAFKPCECEKIKVNDGTRPVFRIGSKEVSDEKSVEGVMKIERV